MEWRLRDARAAVAALQAPAAPVEPHCNAPKQVPFDRKFGCVSRVVIVAAAPAESAHALICIQSRPRSRLPPVEAPLQLGENAKRRTPAASAARGTLSSARRGEQRRGSSSREQRAGGARSRAYRYRRPEHEQAHHCRGRGPGIDCTLLFKFERAVNMQKRGSRGSLVAPCNWL